MKVEANGVDLFFDVEGTHLVAEGPWMRERPTVILLHTGPGVDHSLYKEHAGPALAEVAQVVYLDLRGTGRSDWSSPEHWTLDTWVEDLERVLRCARAGAAVAARDVYRRRDRAPPRGTAAGPDRPARARQHCRAATSTLARSPMIDRLGGPEAGEVAARFFADPTELNFAEFLRVCAPLYTRDPISAGRGGADADEPRPHRGVGADRCARLRRRCRSGGGALPGSRARRR